MKGNAVFYIEESGMNFGPFVPERCFHVEKSPLYAKVSDRGVKTCEFVNLDKNIKVIKQSGCCLLPMS